MTTMQKPTTIYKVEGGDMTGRDAAAEFVRVFWAEPRKVAGWVGTGYFRIVGSDTLFRVELVDGCWEITK